MARRIVHQLVDDIDDSVLEVGEGETVLFSLDGVAYEIDLSDANAAELRATFDRYVAAARRVSSGRSSVAAKQRRRSAGGSQRDLTEIRAWAKANGHQVSERGRVAASVIDAFDAAH